MNTRLSRKKKKQLKNTGWALYLAPGSKSKRYWARLWVTYTTFIHFDSVVKHYATMQPRAVDVYNVDFFRYMSVTRAQTQARSPIAYLDGI